VTLTLSDTASRILDDLPPYESEDPIVRRVIAVLANEWGRIGAAAAGVTMKLFPRYADDEYGTLKMLEAAFGLPQAPAGVSLETRRGLVFAGIRKRNAGAATDWLALLTIAFGTSSWSHEEGPADSTITITIPFAGGSFTAGQAEQIAREVTPAHLDIVINDGEAFLIGVSAVGIDPL
jgi:hypothetical protein